MMVEIALILFLILANGFFALAEMAIVASRKARLRHEADLGHKSYALALQIAKNPSQFLSTIQIVITLIGTLTGAIGGATVAKSLQALLATMPLFKGIAEPLSLGLVVLVTTFVSVVLGELVPKNLALSRPERIAALVIRPLRAFAFLFSPLARFLSAVTDLVIRALGIHADPEPSVTEEEVKVLIAQGAEAGVFEDREREMVEGVLSLDDRRVMSLMTPRTEIEWIDLEDGIKAAKAKILEHSRYAYLPVIEGNPDEVVGMLPVKDALAALVAGRFLDIRSFLRKPVIIPETTSALRAFAAIKESGIKTALLLDEYGGVAGLVTLGDLIESVVGDIPLTGGDEEPEITQRSDGSWLVDGALSIGSFAETLGIGDFPDKGDYETVAGLVLNVMGVIPRPGDRCQWKDCEIEIVDMDGNRIDKLIVSGRPSAAETQV
ncbi:MAG TPA: hemolysin family protein [Rectinemataceae bacterium]|nr:hemolysin family protein [Rectinemataceae bacterium]